MAKRCKAEGCNNPIWSNKYQYCKRHLYLSDEYRKKVIEQRSNQKVYKIPKVSKKRQEELKSYSQIDLFHEMWDEMQTPRICPVSGKKLDYLKGTDLWYSCFAHVLPKGKYPRLKLLKEGVMVVHPDVHTLYDKGTKKQRDKFRNWRWDVLYLKREELLNKYERAK